MRHVNHDAAGAAGWLTLARRRLTSAHPFHGALVAGWAMAPDPGTRTIAVTVRDGRLHLLYNPAFVVSLPIDELVGVLHHEALHVLFGHLLVPRERVPDRAAWIVATEVTVNEWVPEPLPGEPITLALYPDLPPNEDTFTRYRRLAGTLPPPQEFSPTDDHDAWEAAVEEDALARVVVRVAVKAAATDERVDVQSLPAPVRDAVAGWVEEGVRQKEGSRNWRVMLRRHLTERLSPRWTLARPPRRCPELVGVIPARVSGPGRHRVLAGIDTSGSIQPEQLDAIGSELGRLAASAEVVVVECDDQVRAVYPFTGPITRVRGRGGTDLRPPLEGEFLRRHRPDVVVYFTDGCGPAPVRAPRVPVIWCLIGGGKAPVGWGRVVRVG